MGVQANTTVEAFKQVGFIVELREVIESQIDYEGNEYPVITQEAAIHFPDAAGIPLPMYMRETEIVYQFVAHRTGNVLWWDSNSWGNNQYFTNFAQLKGVNILLG